MMSILAGIFPIFDKVVDRLVPDKNEQERMKQEMRLEILKMSAEEQKNAADIIKAEASSEHKWTAMWRPLFMYWLMAAMTMCIAAGLFGRGDLIQVGLDAIPEQMWTLIQVGMGGYIGGRTIEKITRGVNLNIGRQPDPQLSQDPLVIARREG